MNWGLIIVVGVVVLALLIFINLRNRKDKKELTNTLNKDFRKTKDEEGDAQAEDIPK